MPGHSHHTPHSDEAPRAPDADTLADAIAIRLFERLGELTQRRYLTIQHAAAYADLSADTIRSLISSDKLTGLRPVPGRVLIDRRELDALLASSTRTPRRGRGRYERAADDDDDTKAEGG
jgi:excisionase family DNA binding protein